MKTETENPAKTGTGKVRKRRTWNGWTPLAIEAHIGLLKRHPPCAFYSLIYPHGSAPKLHQLKDPIGKLNKSLMDACVRYGYSGTWCLFYESGKITGYHFHIWFTEAPGEALEKAVRKYWLKHTGQRDNTAKSFQASGPVQTVEKMQSYLGKEGKNGWRTKMPQLFLLDPNPRFKPFSFRKGRPSAAKSIRATVPETPVKVTPGINSGGDFPNGKVTFLRLGFPCKHKASSVSEGALREDRVEHIHYREQEGMVELGKEDKPSPRPTVPVFPRHLTAGVRIVSNPGASGMVPPAHREAISHFEKLISAGYTCVATLGMDPLRPDTIMEWVFKVPIGGMMDFERLAGSYRHVRVFRPSGETSGHQLDSAIPA